MERKIEKTISKEKAQQMSNNFDHYIQTISKNNKINYANCAWFDINDLELYLAYAKVKAYKTGEKLSGIRIYFGNYNSKGKKGDLTVFISPTILCKDIEKTPLEDKDLNIDALNFGSAGVPPRKTYPYGQE